MVMVDVTAETNGAPWNRIERALALLDHPRRYYVFFYLRDRIHPIEVDALASRVAEWERTQLDRHAERREVGTALASTHLPMLAEAGVIEYDPETGTVGWREEPTRGGRDR